MLFLKEINTCIPDGRIMFIKSDRKEFYIFYKRFLFQINSSVFLNYKMFHPDQLKLPFPTLSLVSCSLTV